MEGESVDLSESMENSKQQWSEDSTSEVSQSDDSSRSQEHSEEAVVSPTEISPDAEDLPFTAATDDILGIENNDSSLDEQQQQQQGMNTTVDDSFLQAQLDEPNESRLNANQSFAPMDDSLLASGGSTDNDDGDVIRLDDIALTIIRPLSKPSSKGTKKMSIRGKERSMLGVGIRFNNSLVPFNQIQLYERSPVNPEDYRRSEKIRGGKVNFTKTAKFFIDRKELRKLSRRIAEHQNAQKIGLLHLPHTEEGRLEREELMKKAREMKMRRKQSQSWGRATATASASAAATATAKQQQTPLKKPKLRVYAISDSIITEGGKPVVKGVTMFHFSVSYSKIILLNENTRIQLNGFVLPVDLRIPSDIIKGNPKQRYDKDVRREASLGRALFFKGAEMHETNKLKFRLLHDIPIGIQPNDKVHVQMRMIVSKMIEGSPQDVVHTSDFVISANSISFLHEAGVFVSSTENPLPPRTIVSFMRFVTRGSVYGNQLAVAEHWDPFPSRIGAGFFEKRASSASGKLNQMATSADKKLGEFSDRMKANKESFKKRRDSLSNLTSSVSSMSKGITKEVLTRKKIISSITKRGIKYSDISEADMRRLVEVWDKKDFNSKQTQNSILEKYTDRSKGRTKSSSSSGKSREKSRGKTKSSSS